MDIRQVWTESPPLRQSSSKVGPLGYWIDGRDEGGGEHLRGSVADREVGRGLCLTRDSLLGKDTSSFAIHPVREWGRRVGPVGLRGCSSDVRT